MLRYFRFQGLLVAILVLASLGARANNIQVSNVSLVGDNGTSVKIQFDLGWANSWNGNGAPNHDAAWVFVKYRVSNMWYHVKLSTAGHMSPSGSMITVGERIPADPYHPVNNPVVGVMIRRDAPGVGDVQFDGVLLNWQYANEGVFLPDIREVKVFAIEMVYVNQGPFSVGNQGLMRGTDVFSIFSFAYNYGFGANYAGEYAVPYYISSEDAIFTNGGDVTAPTPLALFRGSWENQMGVIPAAFPKGYSAFYCMKYEISQKQYVDFLNTLSREQQNTRTATNLAAGVTSVSNRFVMTNTSSMIARNSIACPATIPATGPITFYCEIIAQFGALGFGGDFLACNSLSWQDLAAYLSWSGLRPMTEFEFEKACRGPYFPEPNDYAWGTNTIATDPYGVVFPGQPGEFMSLATNTTLGNAVYQATSTNLGGPARVGSIAQSAGPNPDRIKTGGSYYGIMELSGNVAEAVVRVSDPNHALYGDKNTMNRRHGLGVLTIDGEGAVPGWPTHAISAVRRGGSYYDFPERLQISSNPEFGISVVFNLEVRNVGHGGRGVRDAQ